MVLQLLTKNPLFLLAHFKLSEIHGITAISAYKNEF